MLVPVKLWQGRSKCCCCLQCLLQWASWYNRTHSDRRENFLCIHKSEWFSITLDGFLSLFGRMVISSSVLVNLGNLCLVNYTLSSPPPEIRTVWMPLEFQGLGMRQYMIFRVDFPLPSSQNIIRQASGRSVGHLRRHYSLSHIVMYLYLRMNLGQWILKPLHLKDKGQEVEECRFGR